MIVMGDVYELDANDIRPVSYTHLGVPMVSGLRAVGQAPAFCDGKLCVLPAVPGRTGSRNL